MSNACSTHATKMNNVASAKYLPGQILMTVQYLPVYLWTRETAYRRPNPKITPVGSITFVPDPPSVKNRSGRNLSGSGYRSGSCVIALSTVLLSEDPLETRARRTYHELTKIVVPSGIKYPPYSSSAILQWATPRGTALCHRRSSWTTAPTYGSASRSTKVGSLLGPTTVSSSALAFCWTSGWRESAGKRLWSAAYCCHPQFSGGFCGPDQGS